MSQIKISTTGTLASVTINDLAASTFVHPVTNLIMFDTDFPQNYPYTITDINNSINLQQAVSNGYITLKDENNNVVTNIHEEIKGITNEEIKIIVDVLETKILDQIDLTVSNGCVWNVLATNGSTNRLLGNINTLHNTVTSNNSSLYGIIHFGTALTDLIFTTIVADGFYKLICQNVSATNSYIVKIKQNYFKA